jgi:tRNA dimethylallyltransferase
MNITTDNQPPVIFLMGPTASGKTDLAIALSKHLPVDVISVDSALIYRDMNIGTAKPTADELAQAPHALINICDPAESYSAADFCRHAQQEIEKSHVANRIPLLVGGTMMYFNALLKGLADMPATDEATRQKIEAEAEAHGWPAVHEELMKVDPVSAEAIHPNHSHRIARALAVYRMSGKAMSAYRKEQAAQASDELTFTERYNVIQLALMPLDRAWLHERIQLRYRTMLAQGFVDEVKALHDRGDLHIDLPSIRSVGYRQVWEYLNGDYDYDAMIDKGTAATRQLAKRQLTWLRGWPDLQLLEIDTTTMALKDCFDKNLKNALNFLPFTSI